MRPIIGITPSLETNESKIYTPTSYPKAVIQAGGTPVFLNFTRDDEMIEQYAAMVDGVLFSGGDDVDPASYDEEQIWGCGDICPLRDDFEIKLLKVLVEKYPEKPVLGICRGAQVLNVAMGGTLYQDLRSQVEGCIRQKDERCCAGHAVHERIDIAFDTPGGRFSFPMQFVYPADRKPHPLLVFLNFRREIYDPY